MSTPTSTTGSISLTAPSSAPPTTTSASQTTTSASPTTTTSAPPTSSNPPSSSDTSSPSTSLSATPSTSSTTSLSTSTTPLTTAATTTSPSTTSLRTTTQGGGVVTQVLTTFVSNSATIAPTSSSDASTSSKGFFSNTGAVAGVFSVVGLIGLALIVALITNGIRRRRARKFDRELQEATLEAASAPKPIFLDDDDDDPYNRSGYAGGSNNYDNGVVGGFSDVSSHGTYGQAPMSVGSHGQESYGMREMGSGSGVGPGEIFDPYSAAGVGAAGAAGIGVARARSMRNPDGGYAAGLQEGSAPYAAFATPSGPATRNPNTNLDILEAAGMGAHVAGAGMLTRNQSQSYNQQQSYNSQYQPYQQQQQLHQRSPSSEYANLDRSKSMGSHEGQNSGPMSSSTAASGATQYFSPVVDSYASHYQQQGYSSQQPQQYQQQQQPDYQQQQRYSVSGDDEDDAYGGYVAEETGHSQGAAASALPNPFERATASSHGHVTGGRQEYDERDGESSDEEEAPKRVLKVANE